MASKLDYPAATMSIQIDGDRGSATHATFKSSIYADGLSVVIQRNLAVTESQLNPDSVAGELVMWSEMPKWRFAVVRRRDLGALMHLVQGNGQTIVEVGATSLAIVEQVFDELEVVFPPVPVGSEPSLPLVFWHYEGGAGYANGRKARVVCWEDIEANYAAKTHAQLATLMDGFAPEGHHGRLLLWHGRPGTGKTYAVRALAWAWREWCRFECVLDPESLLGNAHYLMDVLLRENEDEGDERKWRMLVLEDAGEMMGIDARRRFGQGLSRLLNLTDGLLGQGRNLMVLVTTNEELGKLNPAITRQGRCLSQIEFHQFSAVEANRWLMSANCAQRLDGPRSLSGLYATLSGVSTGNGTTAIGFRPASEPGKVKQ